MDMCDGRRRPAQTSHAAADGNGTNKMVWRDHPAGKTPTKRSQPLRRFLDYRDGIRAQLRMHPVGIPGNALSVVSNDLDDYGLQNRRRNAAACCG